MLRVEHQVLSSSLGIIERDGFALAFQSRRVYFSWKHNCLWLEFGSRLHFYPPICQEIIVSCCRPLVYMSCLCFIDKGKAKVFYYGMEQQNTFFVIYCIVVSCDVTAFISRELLGLKACLFNVTIYLNLRYCCSTVAPSVGK